MRPDQFRRWERRRNAEMGRIVAVGIIAIGIMAIVFLFFSALPPTTSHKVTQHHYAIPAHPGESGGPVANTVWDGEQLTNAAYGAAQGYCGPNNPIVRTTQTQTGYDITVRCPE